MCHRQRHWSSVQTQCWSVNRLWASFQTQCWSVSRLWASVQTQCWSVSRLWASVQSQCWSVNRLWTSFSCVYSLCPFIPGVLCNMDIDECESNPCDPDITKTEECIHKIDYYECVCKSGYAGINCSVSTQRK